MPGTRANLFRVHFVWAVEGIVFSRGDACRRSARGPCGTAGRVRGQSSRFDHTVADSPAAHALDVSPGSYEITGRSPQYDPGTDECQATRPTLVPGRQTTLTDVYCQMR